MNKYPVNIPTEEMLSQVVFAVAAIEDKEVIELRYLENVLGSEYFRITHGVEDFTDEVLDALCFHHKTKKECLELSEVSSTGEVCFGMYEDGMFIEL